MPPSRQLLLAAIAVGGTIALLLAATVALTLATSGLPLTLGKDSIAVLLMLGVLSIIASIAALRELLSRYVLAPLRLADEVGTVVADSKRRVQANGSGELRALAAAINDLAGARERLEQDVDAQVRQAQQSLEAEKNRLAALMSELHQSVIVCNLDGRILLYNHRARAEVGAKLLGLGRSIHAIFDQQLIAHALASVSHRLGHEQAPTAEFITATHGGRLLRVHLAPVPGAATNTPAGAAEPQTSPSIGGFVLMLDDITTTFEHEARRDAVMHTLTEGLRGPLGNVLAAAEMLVSYPDMVQEERSRFLEVIRDEGQALSQRLANAASDYADTLKTRWPLEEVRGADVVSAALQRIIERTGMAASTETLDPTLWIKVDSFSLLQVLTYLATRLCDEYQVREVRLALSRGPRHVHLDLIWSGTAISTETAMTWELDAMRGSGEASSLSVREVVDRCNGEIWFERQRATHSAFFRLLLPLIEPRTETEQAPTAEAGQHERPEFYDFDLFHWSEGGHALDDRLLTELSYTVFDTETTGLQPSEGDEIIQIGATRIVNRRLLRQECFEQLIDPQRRLPPESTAIHGIRPQMLVGQPYIDDVLPLFHSFCADTVLVAHNAAFDMRFLQLKEASSGVRFEQPVLDTLLLSAVLHPNQESHRLEAITERLGITISERHTAMGDALVTAEVFLKMIPLLADKGIHTLRQAREATESTYYARLRY